MTQTAEMGRCSWCGPQPSSNMFPSRTRKSGFCSLCKTCNMLYKRKWRSGEVKHRVFSVKYNTSKPRSYRPEIQNGKGYCLHNEHGYVDLEEFYLAKKSKQGIFPYCIACTKARDKSRRAITSIKKNKVKNSKNTCDCGKTKNLADEACPECIMLDGVCTSQAAVIAVIRLLGGSGTTEQIATAIGKSERQVLRICQDLTKSVAVQVGEDTKEKQQYIFHRLERVEEEIGSAIYWRLVLNGDLKHV